MKKNKIILFAAFALACPFVGFTEEKTALNQAETARARMSNPEQSEFNKMIDSASNVYSALVKGEHGQVPASILGDARCIAIFPDLMTAALIVGGTHGNGLASCKDSAGTWSQPASVSLNEGSFGLQAGVKSAQLVLFFQTEKAEKALKKGEFTLGSDVSAVAGNFDTSVGTPQAGVVAYSETKGLFAGASVNGSKVRVDKAKLAKYYSPTTDYVALLENRQTPDTSGHTRKLTGLFPASQISG